MTRFIRGTIIRFLTCFNFTKVFIRVIKQEERLGKTFDIKERMKVVEIPKIVISFISLL